MDKRHRDRARKHLARLQKIVGGFQKRADGGYEAPDNREIVAVLRAVVMSPKPKLFRSVRDLAETLWAEGLEKLWSGKTTAQQDPWDVHTLENLLTFKDIVISDDDYATLIGKLAERCRVALGAKHVTQDAVLLQVRSLVDKLEASVDKLFDLVGSGLAALSPYVDSALRGPPFWTGEDWANAKLEPRDAVDDIVKELYSLNHRIIYIRGDAFCAKREVLKGVIAKLPGDYFRPDGKRIPVLALAAGAVSTNLFVDQVFRFFWPPELARNRHLSYFDIEGKIAFIRDAARTHPALFIVSDIEPFDEDVIVRRLRGDRVGDVLEAFVMGHPESRIFIGIRSTQGNLPWSIEARTISLKPSHEEFDAAVAQLKPHLRDTIRIDAAKPKLSGLTMRLALPIVQQAAETGRFGSRSQEFVRALTGDRPGEIFSIAWKTFLGPRDRFLLGLISCSSDGLEFATLRRLVRAIRDTRELDARTGAAAPDSSVPLDVPEGDADLRAWSRTRSDWVRSRREIEGVPESDSYGAFYIREPIRRLILEAWMEQETELARDAHWCIAREAADQARELLIRRGPSATEMALGRKLQALNALLASIDPDEIQTPGARLGTHHFSLMETVLPTLTITQRRPPAALAYLYAWVQLYKNDIEAGEHRLLNIHDDPLARLNALMPFVSPHTPWKTLEERKLCTPGRAPLGLDVLGPAARYLPPHEQIELLTGVALAALSVGAFHLMRDAVVLGRLVEDKNPGALSPHQTFRLHRAEIDFAMLCGGNPDFKIASEFCLSPYGSDDAPDQGSLEGVLKRLKTLVSSIGADRRATRSEDEGRRLVRAKWLERLGEVQNMMGKRAAALATFQKIRRVDDGSDRSPGSRSQSTTTIAGRGARHIARFLLEPRHYDIITFPSDLLEWPTPKATTARRILYARAVMNINRIRVGREHWADRIGAVIDEARLLMALQDYELAANRLDDAINIFGRRPDLETLIELSILRATVALEVAMRLKEPTEEGGDYGESKRWVERIKRANSALDTLVQRKHLHVCDAIVKYLRGQAEIAQSRLFPAGSTERRTALGYAAALLGEADSTMKNLGYEVLRSRIEKTMLALPEHHPQSSSR